MPRTEEDRALVKSSFLEGMAIEDLAKSLGRSSAAIVAEIIRQGLVPPNLRFADEAHGTEKAPGRTPALDSAEMKSWFDQPSKALRGLGDTLRLGALEVGQHGVGVGDLERDRCGQLSPKSGSTKIFSILPSSTSME